MALQHSSDMRDPNVDLSAEKAPLPMTLIPIATVERNNYMFVDEWLPRDFVPFNMQAIDNDIVVTYVLHQEGSMFENNGASPAAQMYFTAVTKGPGGLFGYLTAASMGLNERNDQ